MIKRFAGRLATAYSDLPRGSTFRKYLILILVITSLPTMLIAASSYLIALGQIERETAHVQELRLKRVSEMMDMQLAQLQLMLNQWSYHSVFDPKIRTVDFIDDFKFTAELDKMLLTIQMTNPLIENVSLFLDGHSMVFNQSQGPSRLGAADAAPYRQLMRNAKAIFWSYGLTEGEDGNSSLSLVHKLPVAGVAPYGALVVDVSRKRLKDIISENAGSGQLETAFIVRGDKEWITPAALPGSPERSLQEALQAAVLAEPGEREQREQSNPFLLEWMGETYSVSFGRLTRTDWTYISAAPLSVVTGPVRFMSRNMLVSGGMVFVLALLLSVVASARLYRPIRHLSQLFRLDKRSSMDEVTLIERQWRHLSTESEDLHNRLTEQTPALREGFLMQLVQNHLYYLDEGELRKRMKQLGWESGERGFTVMLVQIYGISNLEGRFSSNDQQLIGFAAANIMGELGGARLEQSEVLNFQDLSVALLTSYLLAEDPETVRAGLQELARELSHTLHSLLKTRVTVCIGKLSPEISLIPRVMEEVKQAVGYRRLEDENQIIDLEESVRESRAAVDYPFGVERDILQSLRLGNREMTTELIGSFLQELEGEKGREGREYSLRQGAMQLLGSILHTVLQSGVQPLALFNGEHLFEQLIGLREPQDMLRWFDTAIVEPYSSELKNSHTHKLGQMVGVVQNWIEAEYMNNISLEELADRLGVTAYAVSKAFRLETGMNFIDYLTQHRLEAAKELLQNSDLLIQEIAERVGYQTTYLNRVFKKYLDMTPGQYRECSRK
ncbi:MAG: transcriptional regulator [Paenibacillaceae bacterium]|nr:transcriptional regulator [Paenibacillaceae bacterium]